MRGDLTLTGFDQEALEDFITTFPPAQDKGATDPAAEWKGMPEFDQQDKTAFRSIICHFKDSAAVDAFAQTVGQTITPNAKFIWYPEIEIAHVDLRRRGGRGQGAPRYDVQRRAVGTVDPQVGVEVSRSRGAGQDEVAQRRAV